MNLRPRRRSRRPSVLVRVTLALAMLTLVSRVADAAPAGPDEGPIRVRVAPETQDATRLPGWVQERHPDIAASFPDADGHSHWIEVEIEGQYADYRFRVVAFRDGEPVGEPSPQHPCACTKAELLAGIDQEVEAAVATLAQAARETPEPQPEPEPEPVTEPRHGAEPRYRTITGLGVAGIVVAGVGFGGVVAGATMMAVPPRATDDRIQQNRDYRTPGIVTLVGGAVTAGAGLAVLIVDVARCKRHHERCKVMEAGVGESARPGRPGRGLALAPWVGAIGLGLTGRF